MVILARIYRFNGRLRILGITAEKGNQNSLPKTFILVVAIYDFAWDDQCNLLQPYLSMSGKYVVTSRTTRLEVEESFA